MTIGNRPLKKVPGWGGHPPASWATTRDVIFCVGMRVDSRLPTSVIENYVRRAIDHYHKSDDEQDAFDGVVPPENIIIVEVDLPNEIGASLDVEIDGEPQKLTIRESYKKKLAVFKVLERLRK